jgi:hypothetical protein
MIKVKIVNRTVDKPIVSQSKPMELTEMETFISVNEYLIIQKMFIACSNPGMPHEHIYFRSYDKKLFATDGLIMRVEENIIDTAFELGQDFELFKNDFLIPKSVLVKMNASTDEKSIRIKLHKSDVQLSMFEKVIPVAEVGTSEILLNPKIIVRFLKSLANKSNIHFFFSGIIGAIKVFQEGKFKGLIMPCRKPPEPIEEGTESND